MEPDTTGKFDLVMATVSDRMQAAEWVVRDLVMPRRCILAGEVG